MRRPRSFAQAKLVFHDQNFKQLGHEGVQDDRVGRALGEDVESLLAVLGQRDVVVVEA